MDVALLACVKERQTSADLDLDTTSKDQSSTAPGKASRVAAVQRRRTTARAGQDNSSSNTQQIASDGVAGASEPLPFLEPISRAFGRHDVGDVKTATGGAAAKASEEIGAQAYATGARVAFASSPDLHTAAHEAAHVVQQRAGVQLKGGVGASGDIYERHADRVADLVVRGESAESELDELAGGGQTMAVQRFDSPHHIEIGDSVAGDSITITEEEDQGLIDGEEDYERGAPRSVTFTPGELNALVDYIGDLENIYNYSIDQLLEMKQLLRAGSEDVSDWDRVTGGNYSRESQANEKHFAPNPDGTGSENFRDEYIKHFSNAIGIAQKARIGDGDATLDQARLHLYTAEHYLQDAFSAGHQVSAAPIEEEVLKILSGLDNTAMLPRIAAATFARKQDIISQYDTRNMRNALEWIPINTESRFRDLVVAGGIFKGRAATVDAVRQYIHEELGNHVGVEVSSPAHPEPWVLLGDHDIEKSPESIPPMQDAIAASRAELTHAPIDADPVARATQIFEKHCPVPTPDGEANVREALLNSTESVQAIENAVIESSCHTIIGIMDTVVLSLPLLFRKRTDLKSEPTPFPDIPRHSPETGLDPDRDTDSDEDLDRDFDADVGGI